MDTRCKHSCIGGSQWEGGQAQPQVWYRTGAGIGGGLEQARGFP
jgi:hypothetical protein